MTPARILVLGGSGFIGRHLVNVLCAQGYAVTVPTRRRERAKHLILLPTVDVVQADIHDDAVLDPMVAEHDAVINLVGTLHGRRAHPYGIEFQRAHVDLPSRLHLAASRHGVRRLLHMSALGADPAGPSMYLRSKGGGEQIFLRSTLDVTVFRPSVVCGPDDHFLNMLIGLQRRFPVLPLAGARTKFQPIYVGDVVLAIVHAINNSATHGEAYDLVGPQVYTLKQIAELAGSAAGVSRPILDVPASSARLQAMMMEWLPGTPLLTRDNLDSMRIDSVSQRGIAPELGVQPTRLETVLANGWSKEDPRTAYHRFRSAASRG